MHLGLKRATIHLRPTVVCRKRMLGGLSGVIAMLMQSAASLTVDPAPAFARSQAVTLYAAQHDSAALLRRLRAAQEDLERVRRRTLPFGARSTGGRCDERIGRFCYWHDDEDPWKPPPDHEEVARRRDSFLASLDSASELIPADPWVAAQRVRYLVEAERAESALAVAHDCGASDWWCSALRGYVHHHAGEFVVADSTFSAALQLMSERRRCEWNDLSLLFHGSTRGQYRERACGDRVEFERRFWWLADPFYAFPGNERRSEHYYRIVINEMLEESASPRRMRWGRDNTELLVRFGWAIGWERQRVSGSISASDASIVGYHRKGGRQFLPPPEYFNDPTAIAAGHWELDPQRSRSRYAVPQFAHYAPIEYQIATFRRGDSAVVVVSGGWRHPWENNDIERELDASDSAGLVAGEREDTLRTALALVKAEFTEPVIALDKDGMPLSLVVAREPTLASIEVWNTRDSVAGRERSWLDLAGRLPDGFGVSDILLLEEPDSLPESLDMAIPLTRPNDKVSPRERLGLFWEIYGVGEDPESVDFTLTVARLGKSFLRRAAEWAGIVGRREDTVRLRWSERVSGATSIAPQSIGVQLKGTMSGEYVMTLSVRRSTGEEANVDRHLVVR